MIDFLLYLILISIYYGESEEKRKKNPTKNVQLVIFVTFKINHISNCYALLPQDFVKMENLYIL